MNLEIRNPLETKAWDELIANSGSSSFFHTRAWAEVLHHTYAYIPLYFCSLKPVADRLSILIPFMEINSRITGKRGVSLPFSDSAPLITDTVENTRALVSQLIKYGRMNGWKYIEFRDNIFPDKSITPYESFYVHVLELDQTIDTLYEGLSSSNKRALRKARREGGTFFADNTYQGLKNYYRLHVSTRKRQGVPPQSFSFFSCIFERIILKNRGNIFFVSYQGRPVAGMVLFEFNNHVIYKFGASDMAYQQVRPNNLLFWEAIKWYAEKGYKTLHFGRTDRSHEGLRQFKSGWSARESVLQYYRYDLSHSTYISKNIGESTAISNLLTKMPVTMLKMLGKVAYRHVG